MKIIIFLSIIICVIFNSIELSNSIITSFNLCFNNLFPSIIPFMLVSNFLLDYNFFYNIKSVLKLNKHALGPILLSSIVGSPTIALYLKCEYDKKLINSFDIEKVINIFHFTNPLFIINTVGVTFLENKNLGVIIFLSQYIGVFILYLLFKNKQFSDNDFNTKLNSCSFFSVLNKSILSIYNTLLLILGTIVFTSAVMCLFRINNTIFCPLIEITQGLNFIKNMDINIYLKTIISTFTICFGGISIHFQIFSILDNKKIRYLPYLLSRLLHAIISSFICIIMLFLFFN